jgi:hypothetical protein
MTHVQSESSTCRFQFGYQPEYEFQGSSPSPKSNKEEQPHSASTTIEVKIISQCKPKSSPNPKSAEDPFAERQKGQNYVTHGKIHIMLPLLRTLPAQIKPNQIRRNIKDEGRKTKKERAKK